MHGTGSAGAGPIADMNRLTFPEPAHPGCVMCVWAGDLDQLLRLGAG